MQKAAAERKLLGNCLPNIQKRLAEHSQLLQGLEGQKEATEQTHVDCQSQINLFFKVIQEEVASWQAKELARLQNERDSAVKKVEDARISLADRVEFYQNLETMHADLSKLEDIEFLRETAQRKFLMQHDFTAKPDFAAPKLEVRKTDCLEDVIRSLQDMLTAEKKRQAQLQPSPTLKKPAVLQVNLNQEYVKRRGKPSIAPSPTPLPIPTSTPHIAKKSSIVIP
jgi:hypothetical protein